MSVVIIKFWANAIHIVISVFQFFPQANDRIMALEVADQVVAKQLASDGDLLVDPEEAMMEAKRASSSRGMSFKQEFEKKL